MRRVGSDARVYRDIGVAVNRNDESVNDLRRDSQRLGDRSQLFRQLRNVSKSSRTSFINNENQVHWLETSCSGWGTSGFA